MDLEQRKQRRLDRNEKARRRRALNYACRYLPIELEKEVFSYMKDPYYGRIDVSMKWRKHPIAKLLCHVPDFLSGSQRDFYYYEGRNHGENYITHLAQKILALLNRKHAHSLFGFQRSRIHGTFTLRMQRTIADKAFELAFPEDSNPPTTKVVYMRDLLDWRMTLKCTATRPWEQRLRDVYPTRLEYLAPDAVLWLYVN